MIADGLNANRINKKLSFMKDFFGYCVSHKLYFAGNPFEGLSISNKTKLKAAVRSYEEFTDDELNLIFGNPDYRKLMNEDWAAAGFIDTLLRWKMKLEVGYGNEKAIQPGVQIRGCQAG